jgi:hypothetical protein
MFQFATINAKLLSHQNNGLVEGSHDLWVGGRGRPATELDETSLLGAGTMLTWESRRVKQNLKQKRNAIFGVHELFVASHSGRAVA